MSPRPVAVLGSTGSIGTSALEVIAAHPERWRVVALAARRNVERLAAQVARFRPELVVVGDRSAADALGARAAGARLAWGPAALVEAATAGDIVVNALVGAAGLRPSLAALAAGRRLALANKESLVVGGELVRAAARRGGGEILPVDSEHAGLLQCLAGGERAAVERVVLTASGGPLRHHPDWRAATPAEVLAHPVWAMGPRITTDSATLLNKGFEVIEAHHLFDLPFERIGVWIHPQAAVHALVEWRDGSVTAQLAVPDMRLPIQAALAWPERLPAPIERLDLAALGRLEFEAVRPERWPCLQVALDAGRRGGLAPAVLNAADEVCVGLFHEGQLRLGDLPAVLAAVLDAHPGGAADAVEAIEAADRWARAEARRVAVGV